MFIDLIKEKVFTFDLIKEKVKEWKNNNQKIVFTNGCFDILHLGHITYLAAASNLGDKLVIGLNSDMSVRRLKGDSRPINNEYARSIVLASLMMVDCIVIFEEDTPEKLIKEICPNVLVKGGDYKAEDVVGADIVRNNGGELHIIPFVEGYSTTKIIKEKNK